MNPAQKQKELKRAFFFDRDGIINESPGPGYVQNWTAFRLIPAFPRVLAMVHAAGFAAVVITNQRGVATGAMSMQDVNDIHTRLHALLKSQQLELLDIFVCPHENDTCDCRKPKPGMILAAARKHHIDLTASWMIGDHEKDVQAGHAAGCRTILVSPSPGKTRADYTVPSMEALESLIAKLLPMG